MPIAHCIISSTCKKKSEDLVKLWAEESGKSAEHMTITISQALQQFGNNYQVMANLYLPSLWSNHDISTLQLSLAKALARGMDIEINKIHILTHILQPGMVVENGKRVSW